jgi:membrane-associated phospholipid phosphatase
MKSRLATTQLPTLNRRDLLRMGLAAGVIGATGGLLTTQRTVRADAGGQSREATCDLVEPNAGGWDMWLFSSARALRVAPPPGDAATQRELRALESMAEQRVALLDRIRFWDAGSVYRWVGIGTDMLVKLGFGINPLNGQPLKGLTISRNMALLMTAIYDATIAAWDSKYAFNRLRPSQVDPRLTTAVAVPHSPSYPSEHAAVAGASATILGHLYPSQQSALQAMVAEAVLTRQVAGVEFPSDVAAGLELGHQVGAAAVQRAQNDGAEAPFSVTIPTVDPTGHGNPLWNGTNPIYPGAGTWKTWVMASGSQFRSPQYPDFGSADGIADLNGVVTFNRALNGPNFARNAEAFLAQTDAGQFVGELQALSQRIMEEGLRDNPPRSARVYALHAVAEHDATVSCFESKYYYWRIRPFQAHPGLVTLFPTPNHPSYPAAHGAGSGAAGKMSALLFPRDATALLAAQDLLAQSRLWAGIHYQTDIDAGLAQGKAVADLVFTTRGKIDGVLSPAASAALVACES